MDIDLPGMGEGPPRGGGPEASVGGVGAVVGGVAVGTIHGRIVRGERLDKGNVGRRLFHQRGDVEDEVERAGVLIDLDEGFRRGGSVLPGAGDAIVGVAEIALEFGPLLQVGDTDLALRRLDRQRAIALRQGRVDFLRIGDVDGADPVIVLFPVEGLVERGLGIAVDRQVPAGTFEALEGALVARGAIAAGLQHFGEEGIGHRRGGGRRRVARVIGAGTAVGGGRWRCGVGRLGSRGGPGGAGQQGEDGDQRDERFHRVLRMAATIFWAASSRSSAGMTSSLLCARMALPSLTRVPSRRTTSGTSSPTSFTAAMTPSAITSQRMMPPKMLTRMPFTFGSAVMILKAAVTFFSSAPPPTSRKLAGCSP